MNREEVYAAWAPDDGAWTDWVKPVLFGSMWTDVEAQSNDNSATWLSEALLRPLGDVTQVAVVVELPGVRSVAAGLALGQHGFRPIPLYNAVPFHGAFVALYGVMQALVNGAEAVGQLPLAAPPAFLLDSMRMRRRRLEGYAAPYDNRWVVRSDDFPSPGRLQRAGIRRILLLQETLARPATDLEPTLLAWQASGLELWRLAEDVPAAAALHQLSQRPWYERLATWLSSESPRRRGDGAYGRFYRHGG